MDQQIWQWTLTKEAIAPCFVRDVHDMRQHRDRSVDFFWLGHTPCRTVLLFGMVVGIQIYDKRAIYTIDDGTAVIDCVLRHPRPTLPAQSHNLAQPAGFASTKPVSPKKAHLDKAQLRTLESAELPPPITETGYPVRVVGKVVRHYESKQIHADTIDPCSSLDEIAHLERVIELHKTKYSLAIPFVPPANPTSHLPPLVTSTAQPSMEADASVFSSTSPSIHPDPRSAYSLRTPPPAPLPLQNWNRPPSIPARPHSTNQHPHVPSSPTASSIASSTPSSPCKPSSPVKAHEKPKLRHPSRLHTRDLTANTFRLYVKHYMDNAPPPFLVSCPSPSRSLCGGPMTPTKSARYKDEADEPTPRPRSHPTSRKTWAAGNIADNGDEDTSRLGFTISHLRRVPELALLAARVVRSEARRRERADRERERGNSLVTSSIPVSLPRPNKFGEVNRSRTGTSAAADLPRKKMKRLFSWAVVKLYEEGSIVLWDGDVRPLPVPPPPIFEEGGSRDQNELWSRGDNTISTSTDLSHSCSLSASVLYTSSASALLYSHYHAPRQSSGSRPKHRGSECDVVDTDTDPACLSDPPADEEAYIPLTPRFLAIYVRDALGAMHRGRRGNRNGGGDGTNRAGREPTPEDILAYMQRTDTRWARLGVWVVEEALTLVRAR